MTEKKSEKMKLLFKIVVVVLLVGIIFLEAFFIYRTINPFSEALKIENVDVSFAIGEQSGFNLNKTALTFGTITPGGSAIRNVIVGNNFQFPINVKVFVPKHMTQFLTVEDNLFVRPDESIKIPVTLQASQYAKFGNYFGKLNFVFFKEE